MSKQNELEVLFPEKVVEIRGEKITARPYNWTETVLMAAPFKIIVDALCKQADAIAAFYDLIGDSDVSPLVYVRSFVDILASIEHPVEVTDAIADMIATATGRDKDFVKGLAVDEIVMLGKAVYEANIDFFDRKRVKTIIGETPKTDLPTK